jgi:uncharacterized protein (TIGR03382 family)
MPPTLRAGLAAVLLASAVSQAQTITLNFQGTSSTTFAGGPNDCTNQVPIVQWTSSGLSGANACGSLQVWVTNSASCGSSPGTPSSDGGTDLIIGTFNLSTGTNGNSNSFRFQDLPGLASGGCAAMVDISNAVCASVDYRASTVGSCSTLSASNLTVRYDNVPPNPPSINLLPQDSQIVVQLSANNDPDVLYYRVEYAVQPPGDAGPSWSTLPDISSNITSKPITGLTNETTYLVRARSLDEVNNLSAYSDVLSATPEASNGFWAEYKAAGGHEIGGCNASGVAVPSLVGALVALVTLLRRRR